MNLGTDTGSSVVAISVVIVGGIAVISTLISIAVLINRRLTLRQLRRPVSVLFLGPKESGKTILLLSMLWQMQFRDHNGLRFDADDRGLSNRLIGNLIKARNPERTRRAAVTRVS